MLTKEDFPVVFAILIIGLIMGFTFADILYIEPLKELTRESIDLASSYRDEVIQQHLDFLVCMDHLESVLNETNNWIVNPEIMIQE